MTDSCGVDIDLGDRCSSTAFSWARKTFANRTGSLGAPLQGLDGSFANLMAFGDIQLAMASDGIGTKVEVAERTRRYDTLGFDLLAMVVDDLVAIGAEPVNISNVLDVDHLDHEVVDSLMQGLHAAAAAAGVAVTGGEIAELGSRINGWGQGMHFNWCATGIGVLPAGRRPIDGSLVTAGDVVIALPSDGLRSNGLTLARRILQAAYGEQWHAEPFDKRQSEDGQTWGQAMLTPARIYCRAVLSVLGKGLPVHGIAHITGGGVSGNLARVLKPSGLGAELDNLPAPQAIFRRLIDLGAVDQHLARRQWNMGSGMLLVVPEESAGDTLRQLAAERIDACRAGRVMAEPGILIAPPRD